MRIKLYTYRQGVLKGLLESCIEIFFAKKPERSRLFGDVYKGRKINMSDLELIVRFQSGDWEAIKELLKRYDNFIRSLCWNPFKNLTKEYRRSEEDEDLYYSIKSHFIKYSLKFEINRGTPFAGYISTKLSWKIFNEISKIETYNKYNDSLEGLIELGMSFCYFQNEVDPEIEINLDCLTDRQRRILLLHIDNNYSHQQIADELKVSRSTVSATIRSALIKLRKEIIDGSVN